MKIHRCSYNIFIEAIFPRELVEAPGSCIFLVMLPSDHDDVSREADQMIKSISEGDGMTAEYCKEYQGWIIQYRKSQRG